MSAVLLYIILVYIADKRTHLEKKERHRVNKHKSIRKKKGKGFSWVRRYDVEEEGTSGASSDQPTASSSSGIVLPASVSVLQGK